MRNGGTHEDSPYDVGSIGLIFFFFLNQIMCWETTPNCVSWFRKMDIECNCSKLRYSKWLRNQGTAWIDPCPLKNFQGFHWKIFKIPIVKELIDPEVAFGNHLSNTAHLYVVSPKSFAYTIHQPQNHANQPITSVDPLGSQSTQKSQFLLSSQILQTLQTSPPPHRFINTTSFG